MRTLRQSRLPRLKLARRIGFSALALALLFALTSQLRCAEVADGWNMDTSNGDMGGDGGADGGDSDRCFTGTATTELQLFNHCTDSDHVDRMNHIPKTTWDGTYPLPFSQ